MRPPPRHRFPPLTDVLKYGFETFKAVWKPLLAIGAATVGVGTAISVATTVTATEQMVVFDEGEFSFPTVSAVWFGVGLVVGTLLFLFGSLAGSWLVLDYHDRLVAADDSPRPPLEFVDAGRALSQSIGLFPRWLGWIAAIAAPIVALFVLSFGVPSFLFYNSDNEGVMMLAFMWTMLLLLGAVLLVIPLSLFLGVRWFAFLGFAVIDRPGSPFRRSANVSRGQFWVTLAYLLVLFIIVAVLSSLVQNGGRFMSFVTLAVGLSDNTSLTIVAHMITGAFSVVSAIAVFVLTSGFGGSCLALLYRTANQAPGDANLGHPAADNVPSERPHSIISKA